jgi:diguanylate cyclase (GGDEF)-like protein
VETLELAMVLASVFTFGYVLLELRRRHKAMKAEREKNRKELKRLAKIIVDYKKKENVNAYARHLRASSSAESMKKLLREITIFFPGKIAVTVIEKGAPVPDYCRRPYGWRLVEGIPLSERMYITESEGIEVKIESDTSFVDDDYSSMWMVACFAEAILENALVTRMQRILAERVKLDYLTNLLNRSGFEDRFEEEIERARRHKEPIALVLFDIDNFKEINDTYGHETGDALIIEIAEILRCEDRWPDVSARWGGDEFALILPNTDEKGAVVAAKRILSDVRKIRIPGAPTARATVSVGIATLKEAERYCRKNGNRHKSGQLLFSFADQALYRSKEDGRDQMTVWSRDMGQ